MKSAGIEVRRVGQIAVVKEVFGSVDYVCVYIVVNGISKSPVVMRMAPAHGSSMRYPMARI